MICGALFTARRSDIRKYYPRAVRFRLHPHLAIPPCATVHLPPELNQWSPIPG